MIQYKYPNPLGYQGDNVKIMHKKKLKIKTCFVLKNLIKTIKPKRKPINTAIKAVKPETLAKSLRT
jgi:hypothetical protein